MTAPLYNDYYKYMEVYGAILQKDSVESKQKQEWQRTKSCFFFFLAPLHNLPATLHLCDSWLSKFVLY